jgi:hypothetical protein
MNHIYSEQPSPATECRSHVVEVELSNNTTVVQSLELHAGDSVTNELVIRIRRPLSCGWANVATCRTCDFTRVIILIISRVEMATVGTHVCERHQKPRLCRSFCAGTAST